MKNFRFESICLLSQNERRARKITFSPRRNLMVGRNHTGKSSLIKSLFTALGARPEGSLDRWNKNSVALVRFSMNGESYYALQQQSYRALFTKDGRCLLATAAATEWGAAFSDLIGFNLVLTGRNQDAVGADARALFLPFYINQDGSWHASWSTFPGIQQYRSPVQPILEYFSGLKPPEYYKASALRDIAQAALRELQREQKLVVHVRERFGKTLPLSGPKTVPDIFEQDVSRLTEEVTRLNRQQEDLRNLQVRDQEVFDSLQLQVHMAQEALRTYDGDASFLRTDPHDTLTCPTCGAEHNKTFLDMLHYAEDARVLRELVVRLQADAGKVVKELEKTRGRLHELDQSYRGVSRVLEIRRGDLKFDDVVKSMGAEVAFVAFEDELRGLKLQIDDKLSVIEFYDAKLAELTSRKRSKDILALFRSSYAQARIALNLPFVDTRRLRLTSRPDVSGSGGPRSILAYYAALWATSFGEHGSFTVPLVIDSPQQQGQDETNLPKMIEYVSQNLPDNSQVILGIEANTSEKFDCVIELNEPYQLLQEGEYASVNAVIAPFIEQMYARLFSSSEGQAN